AIDVEEDQPDHASENLNRKQMPRKKKQAQETSWSLLQTIRSQNPPGFCARSCRNSLWEMCSSADWFSLARLNSSFALQHPVDALLRANVLILYHSSRPSSADTHPDRRSRGRNAKPQSPGTRGSLRNNESSAQRPLPIVG